MDEIKIENLILREKIDELEQQNERLLNRKIDAEKERDEAYLKIEELSDMMGKGPYVPLHQYNTLLEQNKKLEVKLIVAKKALVVCLSGSDARALAAKKALEEVNK